MTALTCQAWHAMFGSSHLFFFLEVYIYEWDDIVHHRLSLAQLRRRGSLVHTHRHKNVDQGNNWSEISARDRIFVPDLAISLVFIHSSFFGEFEFLENTPTSGNFPAILIDICEHLGKKELVLVKLQQHLSKSKIRILPNLDFCEFEILSGAKHVEIW